MKILQETFSGESESYSITLEDDGKLVWRRIHNKTKVMLTKIDLTTIDFSETQRSFNQELITENRSLKKDNKEFKRRQETLLKDNQMSHKMLVQLEKERKEIEDRLYARFLPILDAKKAKINELLGNTGGGRIKYDVDTDEDEDEDEDMEMENSKRPRIDD